MKEPMKALLSVKCTYNDVKKIILKNHIVNGWLVSTLNIINNGWFLTIALRSRNNLTQSLIFFFQTFRL